MLFHLIIPLLGIYYNEIISNAGKDLCAMIFFETVHDNEALKISKHQEGKYWVNSAVSHMEYCAAIEMIFKMNI